MMKLFVVLFAGCLGATVIRAQVGPAPESPAGSTNQLVILAQQEARYSQTNVIWRGQVRAAEEGFYVECEVLTAVFSTNAVRAGVAGGDTAPSVTNTNIETKFDRVIAETNVMIITRDSQIVGDRAVYYASNDWLHVTGELVIAANAQGSIVCTNITIDRNTGASWVEGASTFIGMRAIFNRTNAPAGRTNSSSPAPRKK
jgi:hypothetical protein